MKQFLYRIVFLLVLFCSGHAYALTSGTTTTGTILTPGGISYQSFSGTAGQGILLYGYSSIYTVQIKVYRPDGSLWGSAPNRFSGTLPATGSYNVEITSSYPAAATGSYSLDYVQGAGGVSNGSLTSGQSYNGALSTNGLESFQFTGTSGKGVLLYSDAAYTTQINVYAPDGSLWGSNQGRFSGNLPSTGTYTAVVRGNSVGNSGAYTLNYVIGGGGVSNGILSSGQVYNGTLSTNGLDSFQFTGTSGQGVLLFGNAAYTTQINVYAPDGSLWGSNPGRFVGNLPATGTYTAVLRGNSDANYGAYVLNYVRGSSSVSDGTLVSGSARSGVLPNNGLESYKFSAVSGNSLSVTGTSAYTRYFYVYEPDGSLWKTTTTSVTGTIPTTGEYTLVLRGNTAAISGDYTLTATTPPATVAASTPSKIGADNLSCSAVQPPNEIGNPINFDAGFKKQAETDYDAGGLTFSRIYRSDSTWTDNTIGTLWRHNYARTLSFSSSSASITDGTGATIHYTSSGGNWIPDDPATTAKLETVSGNYIYTKPNNTIEKYDANNRLTRIEYVGGGALNLAYNGSSQLISVANENGRQLSMTYASGRVATLTTPDGAFAYSYDGNGNLEEVTRPDTKTTEYHYENGSYVNALTGITDAGGIRFASFGYNVGGKAILSEHAGNTDEYYVTYNGAESTTTNPLGKDSSYLFTNILGVRQAVQENLSASTHSPAASRYFNYDEKGRVIGKTDWEGNTTRYSYDDRGNITQVIKATGSAEQQITNITYNNDFNLPELVTEPGKTTDYDYDTYGRVTSMTVTDTATSESRITNYDYYANTTDGGGNTILGRLKEVDGPRTDVSDITEYAYDGNLNLIKITNALGQETNITARDAAGRPTTIEDENDVETDLVYDTNGWLTSSTIAPGTALQAETAYDYDDNGNLIEVTLPNGVTVQYSYDSAQRLTGVEDAMGNTVTYTLDNAGNITKEEYKNNGAVLKYVHNQVFDELSRIIESVGASSQTDEYVYDKNSNLTRSTDANNNATSYAYDGLLRFTSSTNALNGSTNLGYNPLDDLTSVKDQRNNTTTYTYNAFGDVVGEVSPDRGTLSYIVDKAGNITQRIDARGVVTNYTWDALNRLTSVAYPSDSALNATLTYDLTSGCGTAGIGQLCGVVDASGTIAYEYNILGHLTEVNETRGVTTFTTAYTYDLAGNVLTITLPSGRVITYTRNANGQVSGVSAVIAGSSVNLASSIAYLPFGPITGMTYGNALTLTATYDQDYNPTNRTVSSIYNHTYDTDDNGNITQIGTPTFGYDALNRLNAETPGSVSYTYDATSNRLTKVSGGTTTTTVPSTSNKISAVGGNSITYSSSGAFLTNSTQSYVWNAAEQMAESKISGSTVGTYTYDSQNRRTKKVAGGNTTQYIYGLNGLLYGEYTTAGTLIREYVYLDDAPLAQVDTGSPEVLTYLHTDHLGTPRFGTNTGGTQVWAWASDAFGNGAPTGAATVNLRMPGQYFDTESDLFYNWNRYYNPAIGRYISSDPIGLDGGLNTFLYAEASPMMYIDPEGLEVKKCCRPANILAGAVDHCWLATEEKSAGMASSPQCRTGVGNDYEAPYKTKVFVSDHSCDKPALCTTISDVDEACVNKQLNIGKPLGTFSPWNNCQSFAKDVIAACRIKSTQQPSGARSQKIYGPQLPTNMQR